jgi:hypothetical protein
MAVLGVLPDFYTHPEQRFKKQPPPKETRILDA